MSQSLLVLLVGGVIGSAGLLGALSLAVVRETRRIVAFDRRLGVPRERALASRRRIEARGHSEPGVARDFGLAILKGTSVLAPVGADERAKLSRLLRAAGFEQRDALSYFLSVKLGAGALVGAIAGFLGAESELVGGYPILIAFAAMVGLVIGGILPEYGLRALAGKRLQRMSSALPDALDLMVMCLESGLTFERALTTVSEELMVIEPGLAAEFRLVEAELRLGASRREVLLEFHERTQVEGLKNLAMTLIQSERFGTPLTQSMKNIATGERVQRAASIAARAERLPVLMTLPMLIFVVPGTMLLVAGPAFLTAMNALGNLGGG
ncbi:MAG: type II secretion system F family protein [Immundisolibacterales bacterium]|nr:type II secretion system F family protein [Immundisolibacterales bacterium]